MTEANTGNVQARLDSLKEQIEKGKTEKTRAETNLESYTKQKDEIVTQMGELGVTPENVDAEIAKLEKEIADNLAQAESLLRGE